MSLIVVLAIVTGVFAVSEFNSLAAKISPVSVTTIPGTKPALPATVNVGGSNLAVVWNNVSPTAYAKACTFTVNGVVTATGDVVSCKVTVSGTLIANPFMRVAAPGGSPDPFIEYWDGYYYYVRQDFNQGITIAKSKTLQDMEAAPRVNVYWGATDGGPIDPYWAPELHRINGKWYIYTVGVDPLATSSNKNRMYVLEGTGSSDPQKCQYINKGKIAPTRYVNGNWEINPAQDKWGIDGTVIQNKDGKNYYLWSGWPGDTDVIQNIYIAEMLNPWTLKGDRFLLSTPTENSWESITTNPRVSEGPQIVKKGNKIHMIYSSNGSWTNDYCLARMTVSANEPDLTKRSVWEKDNSGPLFKQKPSAKAFSTGHACMIKSPDGKEDWLIYHAFQTSNGGWADRSARAQKFTWDQNDNPVFGEPIDFGAFQKMPSTKEDLSGRKVYKYEAEEASLTGGASHVLRSRASGGRAVVGLTSSRKLDFTIDVEDAGSYELTVMGNTRAPSSASFATQKITVNGTTDYDITYAGRNTNLDTWNPGYDSTKARGVGLTVNLKKGINGISLTASSSAVSDVDYIYLRCLSVTKVALSSSNITMNVKKSKTINAKALPADAINSKLTYKSANPSIISVKGNKVTAKKVGVGYVNVTAGGKTARVKVTVKSPITKIKFKKSTFSVKRKKTISLNSKKYVRKISPAAKYRTSAKLSWRVNNKKFAKINSKGILTGLKKGKTVVVTVKVGKKKVGSVKVRIK